MAKIDHLWKLNPTKISHYNYGNYSLYQLLLANNFHVQNYRCFAQQKICKLWYYSDIIFLFSVSGAKIVVVPWTTLLVPVITRSLPEAQCYSHSRWHVHVEQPAGNPPFLTINRQRMWGGRCHKFRSTVPCFSKQQDRFLYYAPRTFLNAVNFEENYLTM